MLTGESSKTYFDNIDICWPLSALKTKSGFDSMIETAMTAQVWSDEICLPDVCQHFLSLASHVQIPSTFLLRLKHLRHHSRTSQQNCSARHTSFSLSDNSHNM